MAEEKKKKWYENKSLWIVSGIFILITIVAAIGLYFYTRREISIYSANCECGEEVTRNAKTLQNNLLKLIPENVRNAVKIPEINHKDPNFFTNIATSATEEINKNPEFLDKLKPLVFDPQKWLELAQS